MLTVPPLDDLASFVDDASSKGTILFAMGTVGSFKGAPRGLAETYLDVFNELTDYRIVWNYAGTQLKSVKSHIHLSKWLPQNDLLAHNKTKLFITHGGLKR